MRSVFLPPRSVVAPTPALWVRLLLGAGVGLLIITVFIHDVRGPAVWGEYWKVRPLVITPLAGAAGGLVTYVLALLRLRGTIGGVVAVVAGTVICLVGLWLGIVLGLDGTLWN